ncbi:MAG TPA: NUDIX domain-containing protein [Candidatus Saccharimonadales bacterium]|nr:NUDIX domain-containing protein [Candidatus Saccharimonadales bacterium]
MKYTTPYVAPTLTVDAVVFQLIDGVLNVLLVKRQDDPFKGSWALPGGYNPIGETTNEALQRIITEKTGISVQNDLRYVEQLYTFDTVNRDPRGHAVSVTYMGCGRDIQPASDSSGSFLPINGLPRLAYDHAAIIAYAHERLIAKLAYTNAVYAFLPPTFTLAELQSAYESILGRTLDKRNFRKKIHSLALIHETGDMKREGAHRPAKLYTFNTQNLEVLPRSFD